MKAVILAGGLGTRLRAVTGEHPKPLAPLLGRPVMEHIVELLRDQGFSEICAALHYRAGEIMAHFGDGRRFGVHMEYRIETANLGTAGSVKNCRDLLMELHREKRAAVTIALSRESEPLRYGLAVTDGDGRIRSFIEKPDWPRVVTDLVNTGIYVLSPQVLARVPEGGGDFGRDLFPLLLKEGVPLYGQVMEGYWRDIGTPLDYYRCCADALEGKLKLTPGERFRQPAQEPAADSEEDGCVTLCTCQNRALRHALYVPKPRAPDGDALGADAGARRGLRRRYPPQGAALRAAHQSQRRQLRRARGGEVRRRGIRPRPLSRRRRRGEKAGDVIRFIKATPHNPPAASPGKFVP